MLELEGVETFYGTIQALFGMSLRCEEGQVTTLIGRNGMGKTTTVGSVLGTLTSRSGEIRFDGEVINGRPAYQVAQLGIGLVPEGRQIFPNLSVRENLIATAANYAGGNDPWTLGKVLDFFPRLEERLANQGSQLSGGEQQMLAIGRALMLNPRLLILDEATEGLAPLIRQEIWRRLEQLKQSGLTILLIDKNIDELADIADRHFIIEKGKVAWEGNSDALTGDDELKARYLGI
ncbi:MAG: ABC transporter ATP-binding protein [Gammaproteobacteria bacterium]|nr:ABC transporter ATP-binding protein [Gammaproteobacteria bacterium]MDH3448829.1 ABC transporter ATP-binding protein [Gammaproteobacteria bacterium]